MKSKIKEALLALEESVIGLEITHISEDDNEEGIFFFSNLKKGLKGSININTKELILKTKIK